MRSLFGKENNPLEINVINNITHRLNRIFKLIRLKTFDCSTEEGRSNERYRRAAMTALASAIAKGVSMLTVLISVPLTLNYLGNERYGLWMTISSLIAMLSFADLGLGNGLLNVVSDAKGRDNRQDIIYAVSSTFFMLTGIAVVLGSIFFITYSIIPWPQIYNVSSSKAVIEAGSATAVFIVCFLLNLPLGLVQRIQLGYQEGFYNGLWTALGSFLGLLLVLLVIHLKAGLPWLVLAMSGSVTFASLINGIVLVFKRPYLLPRINKVMHTTAIKILKTGLLFFVLQLAAAVAYTSDNIVIAQILGSDAVAQYSVPFKMFSIIFMIISMVLNPLWPAYGESIARGDTMWVTNTLVKSIKLSLFVTVPAGLILIVFGLPIIHLWAGPQINPSISLLTGLGIWTVMVTCGTAFSMFLNGANVIGFQVIIAIIHATTALCLKILLTRLVGISGIVWATVIAYGLCALVPYFICVPSIIRKLGQSTEKII